MVDYETSRPHKAKTQYLQLQNIVDTSIKHPISVVKGSMYMCLIW